MLYNKLSSIVWLISTLMLVYFLIGRHPVVNIWNEKNYLIIILFIINGISFFVSSWDYLVGKIKSSE